MYPASSAKKSKATCSKIKVFQSAGQQRRERLSSLQDCSAARVICGGAGTSVLGCWCSQDVPPLAYFGGMPPDCRLLKGALRACLSPPARINNTCDEQFPDRWLPLQDHQERRISGRTSGHVSGRPVRAPASKCYTHSWLSSAPLVRATGPSGAQVCRSPQRTTFNGLVAGVASFIAPAVIRRLASVQPKRVETSAAAAIISSGQRVYAARCFRRALGRRRVGGGKIVQVESTWTKPERTWTTSAGRPSGTSRRCWLRCAFDCAVRTPCSTPGPRLHTRPRRSTPLQ